MKIFRFALLFLALISSASAQNDPTEPTARLHRAGDLYDARGFRQGETPIAVDGQLAVSEANGNVSYSYPISERTVDGYKIKTELNYCGSVSFTAFGQRATTGTYREWSKFAANRPAWIIGVNGFAIQALSSARYYFTSPIKSIFPTTPPSQDINIGGLSWMMDGYDYCNRMQSFTWAVPPEANAGASESDVNNHPPDRIRLLRSDGSVLTLEHRYPGNFSFNGNADSTSGLYRGYYYVNEINSKGYGFVEFDTIPYEGSNISYWTSYMKASAPALIGKASVLPRRLHYFPGDGLEYVFREWIIPYGLQIWAARATMAAELGSHAAAPTIFYLEEIRSATSTLTTFTRSRHYPTMGLVSSNNGGVAYDSTKGRAPMMEFDGHRITYSELSIKIEALGRTHILTLDSDPGLMASTGSGNSVDISVDMNYSADTSKLAMVTKIEDPEGRKINFSYQAYTRKYKDFGWPYSVDPNSSWKPVVLLHNKRLSSVYDEHARTKHNISYRGQADTMLIYNSSAPDIPLWALSDMANKLTKLYHNGSVSDSLYSVTYGFNQTKNDPYPYLFMNYSTEKTTKDHRTNKITTDTYFYNVKIIGLGTMISPRTRHTGVVCHMHTADAMTTIDSTVYAPWDSAYIQLPIRKKTSINGLLKSLTTYGYSFEMVRPYGGTTYNANLFGKEVKTDTVYSFRPSDQSNYYTKTVNEYLNLPVLDTTLNRRYGDWDKHASLVAYRTLIDAGYYVDWYKAIASRDTIVYKTRKNADSIYSQHLFSPSTLGLVRKSVVFDSTGYILGGNSNGYRTALYDSIAPRGALVADTVIGRYGVTIPGSSYSYVPYRNKIAQKTNALGAVSHIYYDYRLPEYLSGGSYSLPTAYYKTNLNLDRPKTVNSGEFLEWYNEPAATVSEARFTLDGTTHSKRRLTKLMERTYFGLPGGIVDENGWYSRFDYDAIGRLKTAWLPYDFPNDTIRYPFYNGWKSYAGDSGVVGFSEYSVLDSFILCRNGQGIPVDSGATPGLDYNYNRIFASPSNIVDLWSYDDDSTRCEHAFDPGMLIQNTKKGQNSLLSTDKTVYTYHEQNWKGHISMLPGPNVEILSLDSAKLRLYVSAVTGLCTQVNFAMPAYGYSQTYVFNCYYGSGPYYVSSGNYLELDLSGVKDSIAEYEGGSMVITVLTAGGDIEIATLANDVQPRLFLKGEFREVDRYSDFTLQYNHIIPGQSSITAKVDDSLRTANGLIGPTQAISDNFRLSRSTNYFTNDYKVASSTTVLGDPNFPLNFATRSYSYNGFGAVTRNWDELNDSTSTAYDAEGRVVQTTDENGTITEKAYLYGSPGVTAGFLMTGQDAYGFCEKQVVKDEHGRFHAQYYDAFGRLRREMADTTNLGLRYITQYEHDRLGRLIKVTNPKGDVTRYWYDAFGRVRYKNQPDLGTISYAYDKLGNVRFAQTQAQADSGRMSFYEYDDLNRITLSGEAVPVAPESYTTSYAYSGNDSLWLGRLSDKLNPDLLHNGVPSDPLTVNSTLWAYASGYELKPRIWDGNAAWISTGSALRSPEGWNDYLPDSVFVHRAIAHQFMLDTAASQFEDVFTYTKFARSAVQYDTVPPVQGTVWGAMPAQNSWNAIAPHTRIRNTRGKLTAVAYREHGAEPWHYMMYSYDERGRIEAILRFTGNLGFDAVYYTYNSMNLVTSVRTADYKNSHTTWYSYDHNGRMDSVWSVLSQPGLGVGSPVFLGDTSFYNTPPLRSPATPDITYSYTKRNQVDTMSYPLVSTNVRYHYTKRRFMDSLLTVRNGRTIFTEALSYSASRITDQHYKNERQLSMQHQEYDYDALSRLKDYTQYYPISLAERYSYDAAGNRTAQVDQKQDTSQIYYIIPHLYTYGDPAGPNRLSSVSDSSALINYAYTPDGAMRERKKVDYIGNHWDARKERFRYSYRGLLNQYSTGSIQSVSDSVCQTDVEVAAQCDWRYRYSPFGEREQKRLYSADYGANNGIWPMFWAYYLLGGNKQQLAVYHGTQTQMGEYPFYFDGVTMYPVEYLSYGNGDVSNLSVKFDYHTSGYKEYRIADHLGSTRVLIERHTNDTGFVAGYYDYEPFGEMLPHSWSYTDPRNTYIGKEKDNESGDFNFGVRQYDDAGARFASIDPLWEQMPQWSPYTYSFANPLIYKDPTGKVGDPFTLSAGAITVVGVAAIATTGHVYNYYTNPQYKAAVDRGTQTLGKAVGDGLDVVFNAVSDLVSGDDAKPAPQQQPQAAVPAPAPAPPPPDGDGDKKLSKSQERAIKSYEKQIEKHTQKLQEFIKDPDKFDNKGFLKNASKELREKIINTRVQHLEKEIEGFVREINKIKGSQ